MTDDIPAVRPGNAQLTNMAIAVKAALDVQAAAHLSSRIALFYGPSGYGKTVASAYVAAQLGGVYIRPHSVWTSLTLVRNLAAEVGIAKTARTVPDILGQIIDELRANPRLLIFDEMEFLVKRQLVEIIRDVLDETAVPVMMIGEETLPGKLKEWERVDNRILVRAPAQPASEADALKLRDHYCPRLTVGDDLALHFRDACKGITRRIVVNLMEAQRVAIDEGADTMTLAAWGNRHIENGHVPARRTVR